MVEKIGLTTGDISLIGVGVLFLGIIFKDIWANVLSGFRDRAQAKTALLLASAQVEQASASVALSESTIHKNEDENKRDWMVVSDKLQAEVHRLREEFSELNRKFRHIKLDLQCALGTITVFERERILLTEAATDHEALGSKWRASSTSAWVVIEGNDAGHDDQEFRRIANADYLEAISAEEIMKGQALARQSELTTLDQSRRSSLLQSSALSRMESEESFEYGTASPATTSTKATTATLASTTTVTTATLATATTATAGQLS